MKIERDHKIFESPAYRTDENRFYNIKVNFPSENLILYSDEESYVIARGAEKYPTWVWTADDITREENIVWVKNIQVGNTLFVKP